MWAMLVGAALTLGGLLLGLAFATKSDVLAEAKWWDLMTAFGTVGASVAAVAIPIWQNIDRRLEAKREAAKADWFLANEAVHATIRLRLCLYELSQNWILNNSLRIQEIGAALAALKARCIDDQGVILVAQAVRIANDTCVMLAEAPGECLKPHFQLAVVMNHQLLVDGQADEQRWLTSIRDRARRAGLTLPVNPD